MSTDLIGPDATEVIDKRGPDTAQVLEHEAIQRALHAIDHGKWKVDVAVHKFGPEEIEYVKKRLNLKREPTGPELMWHAQPYEVARSEDNLLTRLGKKRLFDRLFGTASNQAMDATHLRIGVGNVATAAVDTDTDLGAAAGSANRQFKLCDSGNVGSGASSGVFTVIATFGTGVGNFAWAEWGLDGGTADATTVTSDTNTTPGLFNHKITSLGTKTSAASWVFTITITIT